MMFYLIMRDGDPRRWWNEDAERWGTRKGATRYAQSVRLLTGPDGGTFPEGGRWVGPCDGTEE